jgi:hypothetical protein
MVGGPQVQGQPGLHNDNLYQKEKGINKYVLKINFNFSATHKTP